MSKKNRNSWQKSSSHTPAVEPASSPAALALALEVPVAPVVGAISPAQLAANRANALLSTGPRTPAGLAKSSQNAVKSALTGRTVLLPTDDVEEYAAFLAGFQTDLAPVGQPECELVQIIVDCFWRLRRIQALEFALYAHGHYQFENTFDDYPEENHYNMIALQTHLTYEKQFRNWQIQEARLDRKRSKAMAELEHLQHERRANDEQLDQPGIADESSLPDEEFFAVSSAQGDCGPLCAANKSDAGYVPRSIAAAYLAATKPMDRNGFDFLNSRSPVAPSEIAQPENPLAPSKAA